MWPLHSDYSGLSFLKAITSASEDEIQLTRVWVHGSGSEADEGAFPFLFINGGAATLSGLARGAAVVRDVVTHRNIQLLEHTGARLSYFLVALPDPCVSHPRSPNFYNGVSCPDFVLGHGRSDFS